MLLLLCLPLFSNRPAFAADRRIQDVNYVADRIVVIAGRPSIQTMIVFGDTERIENIAVGDSFGWQIAPNKRANHLFIKPVKPGAVTNMTVITDRRVYLFLLTAKSGSAPPLFSLRFVYPPEPEPLPVVKVAEVTPAQSPAEAMLLAPEKLNFSWSASGKKSLLPVRIFDDGHLTYLKWDTAREAPAVYSFQSGGMLAPVNQSMKDGYVVIDHVPTQIVLRLGKATATLENNNAAKPAIEQHASTQTEGR